MFDEEPLFYVKEPYFGCTQPVRPGDILRVRTSGPPQYLRNKTFLVLDATAAELRYNGDYELVPDMLAIGLVDGVEQKLHTDWLESL